MIVDGIKFEVLIRYLEELVKKSYISKDDIEFILNVFREKEDELDTETEEENDK